MFDHYPLYHMHDYPIYHYDSIFSTADLAKTEAFSHINRYIILSDNQTKGRGRMGNTWHSIHGNLMCNIVFTPKNPVDTWSEYSLVMALAISDVVAYYTDTSVHIKWPNDILVQGAKISGFLMENIHAQSDGSKLSIGIGVNIQQSPLIEDYATCALHHFNTTATPKDVLSMIVLRFQDWLKSYDKHGIHSIVAIWKSRIWGIGQNIRVRKPTETLYGVFVDVSDSGNLILGTDQGTQFISSGEVIFG